MKIFILNCFLLINLCVGFSASVQKKSVLAEVTIEPRIRVIVDNDFGGDPDGLFQLVHQVLSPSVEIRGIIGLQSLEIF